MQQAAGRAGAAGAVGGQSPDLPAAQSPAPDDGPDALAYALGGKLAARLVAGGCGSLAAVRAASDAELLAAPGVTPKGLKLIREKVG